MTDWSRGLDRLLDEAGALAHQPPAERDWSGFDGAVRELADAGWTRADVHAAVTELIRRADREEVSGAPGDPADETVADLLGEYETALTGFAHPQSIVRFPGDPEDAEALAGHVRGNAWRSRRSRAPDGA
jgi:hypothetical protein